MGRKRFGAGSFGMAGLTPKQERFALHYFEHGDASKAYRHAYSTERMKPKTVNRCAHDLLKNPKIAARLEELTAKQAERVEINADWVLNCANSSSAYACSNLSKLRQPVRFGSSFNNFITILP